MTGSMLHSVLTVSQAHHATFLTIAHNSSDGQRPDIRSSNWGFGFRPSTHSISTKGMVKAWSAMDTPALLGRDLLTFPKVLNVLQLAEPILPYPKKPPCEILYPRDFMPEDSPE